jgi:HEAT repeat protein
VLFRRKSPHQALIDKLAAAPSAKTRGALVELGADVVEDVVRVIKKGGKSGRHRAELVRVLGQIGPPAEAAIPALIKALDDESERVSGEAGEALYYIGRASIDPLVKQLKQEMKDSGVIAIGVLARFGGHAVPPLVQALEKGNGVVRERAAEALGEIGDPGSGAREALTRALEDKEPLVAREAQRALRRLH